jgi:hypothetical protein
MPGDFDKSVRLVVVRAEQYRNHNPGVIGAPAGGTYSSDERATRRDFPRHGGKPSLFDPGVLSDKLQAAPGETPMAISHCSNCNNIGFEMQESVVTNSEQKIRLVQCSKCGAVVGALNSPADDDLRKLKEAVRKIGDKVGVDLKKILS